MEKRKNNRLESMSDREFIDMPLDCLKERIQSNRGNSLEIISNVLCGLLEVACNMSVSLKKLKEYVDKVTELFIFIEKHQYISSHDIKSYMVTYQQILDEYVPYRTRNQNGNANNRKCFQCSPGRHEKYYHQKATVKAPPEFRNIPEIYGDWLQ